jgi:hypothetical protein
VVNAPIGSVYRQWSRLEDLPKFISAVKEVKKLDAKHFFIAVFHKGKRLNLGKYWNPNRRSKNMVNKTAVNVLGRGGGHFHPAVCIPKKLV